MRISAREFSDVSGTARSLEISRFITLPFLARDPKAIEIVQVILESVLLRREKNMLDVDGKKIVELPPKEVYFLPSLLLFRVHTMPGYNRDPRVFVTGKEDLRLDLAESKEKL